MDRLEWVDLNKQIKKYEPCMSIVYDIYACPVCGHEEGFRGRIGNIPCPECGTDLYSDGKSTYQHVGAVKQIGGKYGTETM